MATVTHVVVLRNIYTSPAAYVDSLVQVCITDNVVELSYSVNPVRQTHGVALLIQMAKSRLRCNKASIPTLHTLSTPGASTIGVSITLRVEIGIPESADVTAEFFDVSDSDVSTVTLTINAPDGKTCTATISTQTYNIEATGRYLTYGWIYHTGSSKYCILFLFQGPSAWRQSSQTAMIAPASLSSKALWLRTPTLAMPAAACKRSAHDSESRPESQKYLSFAPLSIYHVLPTSSFGFLVYAIHPLDV
ncbi:hypothetical protein ARMGADRAFT_1084859 [Armillaria gallica]|uniref:Uncharacterized protein n=1 Tax=Armillaria gallica TaxID=47427 RepID=A0A2H3D9V8_ARMGA|nr:hypothetical protein ARMGADRAFT_1084859 [Armillaria gallica]